MSEEIGDRIEERENRKEEIRQMTDDRRQRAEDTGNRNQERNLGILGCWNWMRG